MQLDADVPQETIAILCLGPPIGVEAALYESTAGAFLDPPDSTFRYAVRLWAVGSACVVEEAKFLAGLLEFSRPVSVDVGRLDIRAEKPLKSSLDLFSGLRRRWKGLKPFCESVQHYEAYGIAGARNFFGS